MEPSSVIHPAVAACSSMAANPASHVVAQGPALRVGGLAGQPPDRVGRDGDIAVRLDGAGIVAR